MELANFLTSGGTSVGLLPCLLTPAATTLDGECGAASSAAGLLFLAIISFVFDFECHPRRESGTSGIMAD